MSEARAGALGAVPIGRASWTRSEHLCSFLESRPDRVDETDVTMEASFVDDLNADSLDLVELIMSLEEEFGTEISDEDAEKIRTVNDAVQYIEEHV